jgi:hypothetical protein
MDTLRFLFFILFYNLLVIRLKSVTAYIYLGTFTTCTHTEKEAMVPRKREKKRKVSLSVSSDVLYLFWIIAFSPPVSRVDLSIDDFYGTQLNWQVSASLTLDFIPLSRLHWASTLPLSPPIPLAYVT